MGDVTPAEMDGAKLTPLMGRKMPQNRGQQDVPQLHPVAPTHKP